MSALGNVLDSLDSMGMLQLLLAFIACTGYALAQGRLVGARVRRGASALAVLGATGFALESAEWMQATMLLAFAVAGLGLFVAIVWVTSSMLGFGRSRLQAAGDVPLADAAAQPDAQAQPARHSEPAHAL